MSARRGLVAEQVGHLAAEPVMSTGSAPYVC